MTQFTLKRIANNGVSTRGQLIDEMGDVLCETLERGPANAEHPRIPAGEYQLEIRRDPSKWDLSMWGLLGAAYSGMIQLVNVPGRFAIEIHPANKWDELLGCIALGNSLQREADGDYFVPFGTARPVFLHWYPILAGKIRFGGLVLRVQDEVAVSVQLAEEEQEHE